jgi:hypothetical protein
VLDLAREIIATQPILAIFLAMVSVIWSDRSISSDSRSV